MEGLVVRVAATHVQRYSTMRPYFTSYLSGSVSGSQGPCNERSGAKHLENHRNGSCQLFSRQRRLFNQNNTTVGRLTAQDIEKARRVKKSEAKQYKQMVSAFFFLIVGDTFNIYLTLQPTSIKNCPSHTKFCVFIAAQWKLQREEGARHSDRKAGELWR